MRKDPAFFLPSSLALFLSLSLLTCKKDHGNVYLDLLENFDIAEKIVETKSFDFRDERTLEFLGRGWSRAAKGGVWADSLYSELRFHTFFPEIDRLGILTCVPFSYPEAPQQTVDLYLNGNHISRIPLEKQKRNYSFPLPRSFLQKGENVLGFKFRYAVSPRETTGKKDPNKRAARFESLKFPLNKWDARPVQKKRKSIVLPLFTQLNYFIRIPERSFLQWTWEYIIQKQKGSRGIPSLEILVQQEGGREESLFRDGHDSASPGKRSLEMALDRFAGKVVRLSFRCVGPDAEEGTPRPVALLIKAKIKQKKAGPKERAAAPPASLSCTGLNDTNILLVVLDAANPSRMSCYGNGRETTPHIDRLADEGVLFTRAYAQASWTVPSVASLFTSTLPITHKVWSRDRMLADKAFTLAEALKKKGFATCAITATSSASSLHNLLQGFDRQIELYKWAPKDLQSGKRLGVVWAEDFIAPVKDWIQQNKNDKFFLYLHYIQPHTPYNPPPPFADEIMQGYTGSVKRRRPIAPHFMDRDTMDHDDIGFVQAMYDANLEYVDFQLGEILEYFKESNLYENTVIVITSDHGEAFLEHGDFGHSSSLYEEEVRIPLVIKFPGNCDVKGKRMGSLVQSIDIMPTLLDIHGLTGMTGGLQGKSLIPLISGGEIPANRFVFASLSKAMAESVTKADALSDGRYKLISTAEERMLFDLDNDPGEKENIFFDRPILGHFYEQWLSVLKQDSGSQKDLFKQINTPLDETTKKHLKALGYIK